MTPLVHVEGHTDQGVRVLRIDGELTLRSNALLLRHADEFAASAATCEVWDISGLSPHAATQLYTVFAAAQRRAGPWPRRTIHLAAPTAEVWRRLGPLRLDRFLPVHASLDDALRAAENEQVQPRLSQRVQLLPTQDAAARARACLDSLLDPRRGKAVPDAHDGARLILSELATNAVVHTHAPFCVDLVASPSRLLVAVSDTSRQEPILRPIRRAAPGGRGVQLVDALSRDWGVRLVHGGGKTVWAELATAA